LNCFPGYAKFGGEKRWGIYYKRLCPFGEYEIVCTEGFVLAQVNKPIREGNRKIIQIKCIFHVLSHGRPMLKFESFYELFKSLNVPNNPSMH
jgi:hypothetical protein